MIKLHEIAGKAWSNMPIAIQHDYEEGIKFALESLPREYNGTTKDCIEYLTDKICIATNNANNKPMYLGCIMLYNAMIKELL